MASNNDPLGLTDVTNTAKSNEKATDPFASQRIGADNPLPTSAQESKALQQGTGAGQPAAGNPKDPNFDRRMSSDEWDAAKTPPSRFQQPKGSVFATPNSRDAHIDKHVDRDAAFHAKLVEKGWAKESDRGGSKGSKGSK